MESPGTGTATNWYGLGDSACYGHTCSFGQFCSDDSFYNSCRNCTDVVIWCQENPTHMASVMPSCFYLCERVEKERLQAEVDGRSPLDPIHIVLITVVVALVIVQPVLVWWSRRKEGKSEDCENDRRSCDGLLNPEDTLSTEVVLAMEAFDEDGTPSTHPKAPLLPNSANCDLRTEDCDTNRGNRQPPEASAPPIDLASSRSDPETASEGDSGTNDLDQSFQSEQGSGEQQPQQPQLPSPIQIEVEVDNFPIKSMDESDCCQVAIGSQTFDTEPLPI